MGVFPVWTGTTAEVDELGVVAGVEAGVDAGVDAREDAAECRVAPQTPGFGLGSPRPFFR